MLLSQTENFRFRKLELNDIPKIQEIYESITGEEGPDEDNLETRMDYGDSLLCLGAETKSGELVGFIFGEIRRGGEFGELDPVGWIGLLGVHPQYQKQSIGRVLGNELLNQFKGVGIKKIRTSVTNNNTALLKFFMNLGLKPADWTILEYETL